MPEHRFYVERIEGETAFLTDAKQLHHLKDVLRLKPGDKVTVSNSDGSDYSGVIIGITRKQAEIKVKKLKTRKKAPVKLTIACAIPKNSRLDDSVDVLTQLGVTRIIPMRTERVVVNLEGARAKERVMRWRKIAQSAAQQSKQSRLPVIDDITDFEDVVLSSQDYDLKLIPHLSGKRTLLRDVLARAKPKSIIVLIGPEGDFTPREVKLALENGFVPVSLGETVLRVTAAAIAAAAYIEFAVNS